MQEFLGILFPVVENRITLFSVILLEQLGIVPVFWETWKFRELANHGERLRLKLFIYSSLYTKAWRILELSRTLGNSAELGRTQNRVFGWTRQYSAELGWIRLNSAELSWTRLNSAGSVGRWLEMAGVMHAINRNSSIHFQSVNCPLICKSSISVFRVLPALRLLMPLVNLLNALSVYMASGF